MAALAGLSVLLIFAGLLGGSSVSQRLQRYAAAQPEQHSHKASRQSFGEALASSSAVANLNKAVDEQNWAANMARELARADLTLKPSEYLALRLGAVVATPLLVFVLSPFVTAFANPIFWLIGVAVGFFAPRFWIRRRQAQRLKAFNSGLADTITLLANSLRAGSSFLQAVEMVVRETRPPISTEFGRVVREVNLGLDLEQALVNMTRRVKSEDLDLMATAITIQYQVGGNLAEILDAIAFTIRERVRIKGEIRSLTAQQRISGYVVGGLPVGLVIIISLVSPTFMEPMFRNPPAFLGAPLGVAFLAAGVFSMMVGFLLIRRIVDIEI
ncbi:MAG TPA: type II secretion system F family protein [Candidatus Limnocylindrales bacterium]|nr:type II secretion system F family protein [Candidatus Limnocylindrales bacterium]